MNFIIARIKSLTERTHASDKLAEVEYRKYVGSAPHLSAKQGDEGLRMYRQHLVRIAPLIRNDIEIRVLKR